MGPLDLCGPLVGMLQCLPRARLSAIAMARKRTTEASFVLAKHLPRYADLNPPMLDYTLSMPAKSSPFIIIARNSGLSKNIRIIFIVFPVFILPSMALSLSGSRPYNRR